MYYLSKQFPNEVMASIASLKYLPIEHDDHCVNHGALSVTTMTCPQSGQQHSKEYPSKLHFLIQFGHFWHQKIKMATAKMPNSNLQKSSG